MANGYMGKILRVDLTSRKIEVEEPPESFYRRYFGGWNIITHYLLKEMPPKADPLGPDNVLVFATGVITGVPFSGSARNAIGARSPLTGALGVTEVGGFWGSELKRAGYDAVVFTGRADAPVYLWIKDDTVELRDASHLWGKTTGETQEAIRAETGEKTARTALIGPGGEKLVRYACVINDLKHAAGRSGLGAVMGSKNLKGIATKGSGAIPVANPERVKDLARFMSQNADNLAHGLHTRGTGGMMRAHILSANIPTNNFRDAQFANAEKISAQAIEESVREKMEACYSCSVRCKKVVKLQEPYVVDPMYGGPEYETLAAFGSCCGIDDLPAICKANELCNAYGLDTISTGATIAFAMESYEAGLIASEQADGMALRFGNADVLVPLVEKIIRREGIGDLLAEGSKLAAARIGGGADRFAIQVKGQEFPMHEPRYKRALALGYAVSPTGADHQHAFHDAGYEKVGSSLEALQTLGVMEPVPLEDLGPRKVRMYAYSMNWSVLGNCLVMCDFVPWTHAQEVELVQAVTGWNSSAWELGKVGERAIAMARAFNVRAGFGPKDDWLPERMFVGQTSGPLKDAGVDRAALENAKQLYYDMMGWDAISGAPRPGKLAELDIDWVSEHLPVSQTAAS